MTRDGKGKRDIPDWHAVGVFHIVIFEFYNIDAGGAYSRDFAFKFNASCESAHGRYTAVSTGNPDDDPARLLGNYLLPKRGIIAKGTAF